MSTMRRENVRPSPAASMETPCCCPCDSSAKPGCKWECWYTGRKRPAKLLVVSDAGAGAPLVTFEQQKCNDSACSAVLRNGSVVCYQLWRVEIHLHSTHCLKEMDDLPVINPKLFTALVVGGASHHSGSKKVCVDMPFAACMFHSQPLQGPQSLKLYVPTATPPPCQGRLADGCMHTVFTSTIQSSATNQPAY